MTEAGKPLDALRELVKKWNEHDEQNPGPYERGIGNLHPYAVCAEELEDWLAAHAEAAPATRPWYADEIYVCGEDAGGRPGGEVLAQCEPTRSGLFDREFGRKLAKKIVNAVNSASGHGEPAAPAAPGLREAVMQEAEWWSKQPVFAQAHAALHLQWGSAPGFECSYCNRLNEACAAITAPENKDGK